MSDVASHEELAATLRRRVLESGVIPREVRATLLTGGGGTPDALPEPYRVVAEEIYEASYRVTDEQMADVARIAGSDRAAFEVVMSASIGAGLRRWDAALRAIGETTDATG